ncbi:MAG: capsule assembly Wzi family protein [Spirochaetaceae bacterium]|nr:capsule assembly Wzi family protein [Spirochaetaceae bacterium]
MRMRRGTLVLLCGLVLSAGLYASPLVIVSAGDPVLEDIRYVAREAGAGILSFTPPLSRDEIVNILAAAEPENLPLPAQEAYRRIQDRLNPPMRFTEDYFSLAFHGAVQAEAGFRTNTAVPWRQGDFQRPAVLRLPLDFYFADFVLLNLELAVNLDPAFNEKNGHFVTNVPWPSEHVDMFFPFRAFAAAGGKWWNFQIGRDQITFGTARTGNLLLSDTPDYYDFARLSLFSKHFKYSALVIHNPLFLSEKFYDSPETEGIYLQRHIYIHRIDFSLFNKVSVGITEGLSVGNAPLEIRYLNPLMILHNFMSGDDYDPLLDFSYNEMNSSIFSLEVNWTPVPAFSFYAQLALDEFTTPWETESDADNKTPQGIGYLAGAEYSRAFGSWGALFYAEAAYLDPYIYVDNSPWAAFVWSRRMNRKAMEFRYRWIGHPEGRDTIVFAAGSRFSRNDQLALSAALSFTVHGEHGIYWDWRRGDQYAAETAPTGTAEKKLAASLGAEWKPVPAVTLSAELGGALILNAQHTEAREFGAEAQLSVKYVF